jgi:hypothetical protein
MTARPNASVDEGRVVTAPDAPVSRAVIFAVAALTSAATSAGITLTYHLARPAPVRFATLNVAQLFTERQEELMKLAAQGSGEAGSQKALELAKTFGRQLEAEALALPQACGCVVLVRGAVVAGSDLPDYTDAIRERLKPR